MEETPRENGHRERLRFWTNPIEVAAIEEAARSRGMSLGQYLRWAALQFIPPWLVVREEKRQ